MARLRHGHRVGADTIRRAAAVHPIADLQIEYSLISRGIEDNGIRFRNASPRFQQGNVEANLLSAGTS